MTSELINEYKSSGVSIAALEWRGSLYRVLSLVIVWFSTSGAMMRYNLFIYYLFFCCYSCLRYISSSTRVSVARYGCRWNYLHIIRLGGWDRQGQWRRRNFHEVMYSGLCVHFWCFIRYLHNIVHFVASSATTNAGTRLLRWGWVCSS